MNNKTSIDLSIIVPVYNGEATINRCLKSLCTKSNIEYEIIIVNDNSTDNTLSIIEKNYSNNANINIINNHQNLGAGLSRNKGLEKAKGKYVGFVDCDDWVDYNLFVNAINILNKTKADIGIFGVMNEYGNFCTSTPRYEYSNEISFPTKSAIDILSRNITNSEYISPMICQKIYKRNFLLDNHIIFNGNRYFEDDIFTYLSFTFEGIVTLIPKVVYHYSQSPHSVSHRISKDYIQSFSLAFKKIKKELIDRNIFDEMKDNYYSYLDKGLMSVLSVIHTEEQNVSIQKKYISELLISLQDIISLDDFINYIDITRLYRIWK